MRRAVGVLLVIVAVCVGAIGLLWAILAVVGREWDYCPSSGCIAGELVGLALVAVAAVTAWIGVRTAVRR